MSRAATTGPALVRDTAGAGPFRMRLICLPYAGAGASVYRSWVGVMGRAGIAVCPVQPPGREDRIAEEPIPVMAPLVDQLAEAIEPLCGEPYALFGHSLGALVGFETARELARRSLPLPRRLVVTAHRAPHISSPHQTMYRLGDREFLDNVRRLGGTPPEVFAHEELLALVMPCLRGDFELLGTYACAPGPAVQCPVSVWGGRQDSTVPLAELVAWRDHVARRVRLRLFDGGHFYPWECPNGLHAPHPPAAVFGALMEELDLEED